MRKDSKYVKINSVNLSYLIFIKVNEYCEEIYGNKYLTLVPTNESKEKIKNMDLIRSITKCSDNYNYDEKYMKIKFNSDIELLLNKRIPSITIVARTIFYVNNKYYPQLFLDKMNVCIMGNGK